MGEKETIEASLNRFGIDKENHQIYDLLSRKPFAKVLNSKFLRENDELILKLKSSANAENSQTLEESEIIMSKDNFISKDDEQQNLYNRSFRNSEQSSQISEIDVSDVSYYTSEGIAQSDDSDESYISEPSYSFSGEFNEFIKDAEEESEDEKDKDKNIVKIGLKDLKDQVFETREAIKEKVDQWCCQKMFKVNFKSQERAQVDGTLVSTLYCNKKSSKSCTFFLEFRTNDQKLYVLSRYCNTHTHKLNEFHDAAAITKEIHNRIKSLRLTSKSYGALTKAINEEFKLNFHKQVIYYKAKQIEQEELGKINEDAQNLVKLLQKDSAERNGFYKTKVSAENKLTGMCYMSSRMKAMLQYFPDVIILDSSHKTNRFNMPLFDVVVVNNLGKTITGFFALLEKQNYENYLWTLEAMKNELRRTPQVIFSDDEGTLTKGFLFCCHYLYIYCSCKTSFQGLKI